MEDREIIQARGWRFGCPAFVMRNVESGDYAAIPGASTESWAYDFAESMM